MKQRLITLGILLLLISTSYAQEPQEPTQPPEPPTSSVSLQKLIVSISETKAEITTLKRDMQEFKTQLDIRLARQQRSTLLFLVIINIAYLALLKILERFGAWIIWKKRKRDVQIFQERVLNNFMAIDSSTQSLKEKIDDIQKQIIKLKIEPSTPTPLTKTKKSLTKANKIIIFIILTIITLMVIYVWQVV